MYFSSISVQPQAFFAHIAPFWCPRFAPIRPRAISLEPASVWRGRDVQRETAGSPQVAHFREPKSPGMHSLSLNSTIEQTIQDSPGTWGKGMMTGSNTPWAQGPANFWCKKWNVGDPHFMHFWAISPKSFLGLIVLETAPF